MLFHARTTMPLTLEDFNHRKESRITSEDRGNGSSDQTSKSRSDSSGRSASFSGKKIAKPADWVFGSEGPGYREVNGPLTNHQIYS